MQGLTFPAIPSVEQKGPWDDCFKVKDEEPQLFF